MNYSEMSVEQLQNALEAVNKEIDEAGSPKPSFMIRDAEDCGDEFQENLELGWHLNELRDNKGKILQELWSRGANTQVHEDDETEDEDVDDKGW